MEKKSSSCSFFFSEDNTHLFAAPNVCSDALSTSIVAIAKANSNTDAPPTVETQEVDLTQHDPQNPPRASTFSSSGGPSSVTQGGSFESSNAANNNNVTYDDQLQGLPSSSSSVQGLPSSSSRVQTVSALRKAIEDIMVKATELIVDASICCAQVDSSKFIRNPLEQLLTKKAKKWRLLITALDKDMCKGCRIKTNVFVMKCVRWKSKMKEPFLDICSFLKESKVKRALVTKDTDNGVMIYKPRRMTPHLRKLEYNRSNRQFGRQGIELLPRGMKSFPKQFSRLPYYEQLEIAHLFDTMHIGKNVIEMLWRILDGRRDKEKISKICSDIQEANHAMLNIIDLNRTNGVDRNSLPWLFKEDEGNVVKEFIRKIRFPTGFASNIKNILTKKGEFGGLKTHDWHTFIKYMLPLSLPDNFDNNVKQVIYDLGKYKRWLSSKEIHKEDIKYWKREITRLMCAMQKYLPPAFFNAQEHYLIHQVEEIELCGPVHTRSMWMVERHLKSLKALVRQRARPEGSMVEGYMVYQTLVYISDYLPDLGRKINMHCSWGVINDKILEVEVLVGNGNWLPKNKGNEIQIDKCKSN